MLKEAKGFNVLLLNWYWGAIFHYVSEYRLFVVLFLQGLEFCFENIFVGKFGAVIKFAYYYTLFTAANFRQA